jgi:hypothetical protein
MKKLVLRGLETESRRLEDTGLLEIFAWMRIRP